MPIFLASGFLIGLLGLAIPILVHLWNTKDSKVIKVGSIRFLQESDSVKVNRIHFSEIPLMLLRLLILLVLVLLLSDMRFDFFKAESTEVKWVLVDPDVASQPHLLDTLTILAENGWQIRYLAPDFPVLADGLDSSSALNIWSLLKALDISPDAPDSLIALSTFNWSGFYGNRRQLAMPVAWIEVPMLSSNPYPALALARADSMLIYIAANDGVNLKLEPSDLPYEVIGDAPVQSVRFNTPTDLELNVLWIDTTKININGDPESVAYQNLLAALNALQALSGQPMKIDDFSDPQIVFNLEKTDQKGSERTFNYSPEALRSEMLVHDRNQLNTYSITKLLEVDQIMAHDFVQSLYPIITISYDKEVIRNSHMSLPISTIRPALNLSTNPASSPELASLQMPLWILLIFLIGAERVLAHRRKQ
jgi:hypothetical protein